MVSDASSGKPRGYAFIEYVHKSDMKTAYKRADGKKIEGRRVLVDVERGRTVPDWKPRRLGGGKGVGRQDKNLTKDQSGAEAKHAIRDTTGIPMATSNGGAYHRAGEGEEERGEEEREKK